MYLWRDKMWKGLTRSKYFLTWWICTHFLDQFGMLPYFVQVVEMYSSGGDLHLELPTGQQGGTGKLWVSPSSGCNLLFYFFINFLSHWRQPPPPSRRFLLSRRRGWWEPASLRETRTTTRLSSGSKPTLQMRTSSSSSRLRWRLRQVRFWIFLIQNSSIHLPHRRNPLILITIRSSRYILLHRNAWLWNASITRYVELRENAFCNCRK